jgi:hypothetical protein
MITTPIGRCATGALALLVLTTCGRHDEVRAVREAVLRQQVAYWLADHARESGLVVCLPIARSEAAALTSELTPQDPTAVRSTEDCDLKPSGAIDRTTSRPAVVIKLTGLAWVAPDEAVVEVEHFRSSLTSGRRKYRVVQEHDEWVCLGPILDITPA